MATQSKTVYLGNVDGEYCGFTPGNEYDFWDLGDGFIGVYDDSNIHRCVKNGVFHKFGIHKYDEDFVTETECAVTDARSHKKPELRYYINGHEVDMIEFENVRYKVDQLDEDGVKCDTIKFEVKFE